jgi:hypothetical protein
VKFLTEPAKPFSLLVNVPMVAMIDLSLSVSGRAHRDLDGDQKTEGRSICSRPGSQRARALGGHRPAAPAKDGAGRLFCFALQSRVYSAAEKSWTAPLQEGDRGAAVPRSDQAIRGRVDAVRTKQRNDAATTDGFVHERRSRANKK